MAVVSIPLALLPTATGAALAGGVAVTLLVLARPEWGLYLLAFSVPFGSELALRVGPVQVTPTEGLVVLTLAGWFARGAARRSLPVRLTPLAGPFAVLFGALLLSASVAESLPLALKELLKWAEFAAVFLFAANGLERPAQGRRLLIALLLALAAESLLGWYQFFFRAGPEGFLIGERFLRAYGTFGQPNPFGGYLALTLPLACSLLLVQRLGHLPVERRGLLALAAAAALLAAGALAMSLSRGAWLGTAAGVALMVGLLSRRAAFGLLIGLMVTGLLGLLGTLDLLPAELAERLGSLTRNVAIFDPREVVLTPENWAIVERMANWFSAWQMYLDHPVLGVGPGNFGERYGDYALKAWQIPTPHAHNYYLNALAETGIVGLSGYLLLLAGILVYTGAALRRAAPVQRPLDPSPGGPAHEGPGTSGQWAVGSGQFPAPPSRAGVGLLTNVRAYGCTPLLPTGTHWVAYPVALGALGGVMALTVHSVFDNLLVHGMTVQLALMLGAIEGVRSRHALGG